MEQLIQDMTKTKHYNYIRDELNKTFPERLKLKFGCEIKTYHNHTEEEITARYLRTDDSDEEEYWVDSWHIQDGIPGWGSQPRINECSKVIKILGTKPTIIEVLRWLKTKDKWYAIGSNGELIVDQDHNSDYILYAFDSMHWGFNLSKPNLSDQSDEVIKSVALLMGYKD